MGYAYVGTVDTVLRAMETQQKRQPVDWVFCYTYNTPGAAPDADEIDRDVLDQGDAAFPLKTSGGRSWAC